MSGAIMTQWVRLLINCGLRVTNDNGDDTGKIISKGFEVGLAINLTLLLKWDPIEKPLLL